MVEAGLIQPALVSKADGQRYEASFEREHHDHLVCTTCRQGDSNTSPRRSRHCNAEIAQRYDFELGRPGSRASGSLQVVPARRALTPQISAATFR